MKLKKLLGKRIQELRTKNGLKQSELAEKVGIATKHQVVLKLVKTIRQRNWLKIMQKFLAWM